jgi:hypothetical protein
MLREQHAGFTRPDRSPRRFCPTWRLPVEHVVFFPSPDGAPAFRRVPTFEEAVRLVEHLRNVEG